MVQHVTPSECLPLPANTQEHPYLSPNRENEKVAMGCLHAWLDYATASSNSLEAMGSQEGYKKPGRNV